MSSAPAAKPLLNGLRAWFERIKTDNEQLEDEARSRRHTAISLDELKKVAYQHPNEGMRNFVLIPSCPQWTTACDLSEY